MERPCPLIFPVPFDALEQLPARLQRLRMLAVSQLECEAIARAVWSDTSLMGELSTAKYCLVLVAGDVGQLQNELNRFDTSHRTAWEAGSEWRTPGGSCLARHPQGQSGGTAFVYPGIGSLYADFGRELLSSFPRTAQHLSHRIGRDVDELLATRFVATRSADALFDDPGGLAEYGVLMAYCCTDVLRTHFGLHPDLALGYSLGEISMFASLGTWQRPELLLDRMQHWDRFRRCINLREPQLGADHTQWFTRIIQAPRDNVVSCVSEHPQCHLTHINTADECIMTGPVTQLDQLCHELGCRFTELPYAFAFHTSLLKPLSAEIHNTYSLQIDRRPDVLFISQAPYVKVPHHTESIAGCLEQMLCHTVDFPAIVESAYRAGARVFVTAGPRVACCQWIDANLEDRPHVAIAIDPPGMSTTNGVSNAMARLLTHRVAFQYQALRPADN